MSEERIKAGGFGFFDGLALLFIAFKLAGIINWSWWVVLLPMIVPLTILLFLILVVILREI